MDLGDLREVLLEQGFTPWKSTVHLPPQGYGRIEVFVSDEAELNKVYQLALKHCRDRRCFEITATPSMRLVEQTPEEQPAAA